MKDWTPTIPDFFYTHTKYFLAFISVMLYLVSVMYNSVFISILTAKKSDIVVDSMRDLQIKYKHIRIYVADGFRKTRQFKTFSPEVSMT